LNFPAIEVSICLWYHDTMKHEMSCPRRALHVGPLVAELASQRPNAASVSNY